MVHILSSIEDEHCSSSIFILEEQNVQLLEPTVGASCCYNLCTKVFTLDNFSYRATNEM
jgi:hypothetical protein